MRYQPDHKDETRNRILNAAGKAFRSSGFGGIGVDGLAKGADLTSGAFYVHFPSKIEAFNAAIRHGLEELRSAIESFQATNAAGWLSRFASFYMQDRRTCHLQDGCAFQTMASDVERIGGETRLIYEEKLREIIDQLAVGLTGGAATRRREAFRIIALLAGGLTMARTVVDPVFSDEIARSVEKTVSSIKAKKCLQPVPKPKRN